jgi:hypothetical protein
MEVVMAQQLTTQQTSWTEAFIGLHLHQSAADEVPVGKPVEPDDAPGNPSNGGSPTLGNNDPNDGQTPIPVPELPPNEMKDEAIAGAIMEKQEAILTGWQTAVLMFQTVMTSAADAETSPNFEKTIVNFVADQLIGKVVAKASTNVPGLAEVVGLIKGLQAEAAKAATASASAVLRDFVVAHLRTIGSLTQSLKSRKEDVKAAVEKRRVEAEALFARPAGKKTGEWEVVKPTNAQNDYAMTRMALLDLLDDVKAVLAVSGPNALVKVLVGGWLSSTQTKLNALSAKDPSWIHIRLDGNHDTIDAVIRGPGGQKLAEELLKESPAGVDVWSIHTLRKVFFTPPGGSGTEAHIDGNGRDVTPQAARTKDSEALFKYVSTYGVKPTKNITGT